MIVMDKIKAFELTLDIFNRLNSFDAKGVKMDCW